MRSSRNSLGVAVLGTLFGVFSLLISSGAYATSPINLNINAYECDVSGQNHTNGLSSCPNNPGGGTRTSAKVAAVLGNNDDVTCNSPAFCGVESDANTSAVTPVDAHGTCEWIDNTSETNTIFVPFRSAYEWQDFLNPKNLPSYITLTPCSLPQVPASALLQVPYPAGSSVSVDGPLVYGRADGTGTSVWPSLPQLLTSGLFTSGGFSLASTVLTSYGGATTIQADLQWVAGSPANTPWVLHTVFSPNTTMTAQDTTTGGMAATAITITAGDTVQLAWSATSIYAPITSNVASSGNWIIINPAAISGTATVTPAASTTYVITSTDKNGLVSVATATVTVNPVGKCGTDANQTLSNPPVNLCQPSNTPSAVTPNAGGWTWTCKPLFGVPTSCSATLQLAQCGVGVAIDSSGNVVNGTPCVFGTVSTIDPTTGAYTCTTGAGPATNVASCTAIPQGNYCGADANQTLSNAPVNLCQPGNTPSGVVPNTGGWSWICTPLIGVPTSCTATLQLAQCGASVTVDSSGNVISGIACNFGTVSAIDPITGAYTCTTGAGMASNVASCTAITASCFVANQRSIPVVDTTFGDPPACTGVVLYRSGQFADPSTAVVQGWFHTAGQNCNITCFDWSITWDPKKGVDVEHVWGMSGVPTKAPGQIAIVTSP